VKFCAVLTSKVVTAFASAFLGAIVKSEQEAKMAKEQQFVALREAFPAKRKSMGADLNLIQSRWDKNDVEGAWPVGLEFTSAWPAR